jgi:hypothetical protein
MNQISQLYVTTVPVAARFSKNVAPVPTPFQVLRFQCLLFFLWIFMMKWEKVDLKLANLIFFKCFLFSF